MNEKCFELYQPFAHLSIDECMVKSKARSHFRQYIRNKPTKWGFKYWVLSDPTGYTFDLYCAAQQCQPISSNGLSCDVVMQLVQPFMFQGYEVFMDNFNTSPSLHAALLSIEMFWQEHWTYPDMEFHLKSCNWKQPWSTALFQGKLAIIFMGKIHPPIVYICWCHPDIHSVPWTWGWHCQTKSKGLHGTKCYCDGSENSYCSWLHDVARSCNCQLGS